MISIRVTEAAQNVINRLRGRCRKSKKKNGGTRSSKKPRLTKMKKKSRFTKIKKNPRLTKRDIFFT